MRENEWWDRVWPSVENQARRAWLAARYRCRVAYFAGYGDDMYSAAVVYDRGVARPPAGPLLRGVAVLVAVVVGYVAPTKRPFGKSPSAGSPAGSPLMPVAAVEV